MKSNFIAAATAQAWPNHQPSFKITPDAIPDTALYGRDSLATQINQDGSIGYCPHNLIVDTIGLSSGWANTRSTTVKNVGIDPDGYPCHKLVDDTGVNTDHRLQSASVSTTAGLTYKTSIMAKAGERTGISVWTNHYNTRYAEINLLNGTTYNNGFSAGMLSVESKADGWWKITITQVAQATQTSIGIYFTTIGSSGSYLYTGDGTSGIYFSQPQMSIGDHPYYATGTTSYYGLRTQDYSNSLVPSYDGELVKVPGVPSGSSSVVSPGKYRLYSVSGEYTAITFGSPLTVGKAYEITFRIVSIVVAGSGVSTDAMTAGPIAPATVGMQKLTVVATSTGMSLKRAGAACDMVIDTVSCREITDYVGSIPSVKVEQAATNFIKNTEQLSAWTDWSATLSITAAGKHRNRTLWSVKKGTVDTSEGVGTLIGSTIGTYTLRCVFFADTSTTANFGLYSFTISGFYPATATVVYGPGKVSGTNIINVTNLATNAPTMVEVKFTITASSSTLILYPDTAASTIIGNGIKVQFDNLEAGPVATSYIPTYGTIATRNAEVPLFVRGSLATQMNSSGVLEYCPHNLVQKSEGVVPVAGGTNPPTISRELDIATNTVCSVATFTAHATGGYNEGNAVWDGANMALSAGQLYLYEAEVWHTTGTGGTTGIQFYLQSLSTTPGSDVYWTNGTAPAGAWFKLQFCFTPTANTSNAKLSAYRATTTAAATAVKVRKQSIKAIMEKPAGFTQVETGVIANYYPTYGSAYYGLRTQDYSDSLTYTLGSELIVNGDFSNGLTGWVADGSGTHSTVGGYYSGTTGSATNVALTTTIALTAGKSYLLKYNRPVTNPTHASNFYILNPSYDITLNPLFTSAAGNYEHVFTAKNTGTATLNYVTSGSVQQLTLDNVSCREITGYGVTSKGIKIESQATNYIVNNTDLATATKWGSVVVGTPTTRSGIVVQQISRSGSTGIEEAVALTTTASTVEDYSFRLVALAGSASKLDVGHWNGTWSPNTYKVVSGPGKLMGSGVLNLVRLYNLSPTIPTIIDMVIAVPSNGSMVIYPSGFNTQSGTDGVYVRADNLENGKVQSSRIPTYGTAITRGGDVWKIPTATFSTKSSVGTLSMGWAYNTNGHNAVWPGLFRMNMAVGQLGAFFDDPSVFDNVITNYRKSGVDIYVTDAGLSLLPKTKHKVAFVYNATSVQTFTNGGTGTKQTDLTITNPVSLQIGYYDHQLGGTFYSIDHYPYNIDFNRVKAMTSVGA